ncbi:MAG: phage head morphogenesis protein, partial [Treponema sp.]|nr:phage head morphogenesis protein [Treponema sp.]
VEAKKYLSRKAIVETEDWDDLKWGEHAHAFTVAHSRNAGVLNEIFGLLNKAMADGESFNKFKKEMRGLMEDAGWYGRSDKGPDDKDYINWRTQLIYHTNMSTAYHAGRYRQQLRGAELRPIWVYLSQLVGDNRREDHIALHDKAFPFDDPFWNSNYPKNGWGCECEVVTLSISGAEREGVEVLHSDSDGNPPTMIDKKGRAIDWDKFTPTTWRYNPGREALAPNFRSYTNLANCRMGDGRSALAHVAERYRQDMDGTRLTSGEFDAIVRRMNEKDYTPQGINYQIGNLDRQRHEAMIKNKIDDSKIMAADSDLYHGIADKNARQKIPQDQFKKLYQMLQTPEKIFEETNLDHPRQGRVFHFVHDTHDGKVLKVVLKQQLPTTALRIVTMAWVEDHYGDARYKKIW